jgi:hypothetical protein
MKRTLAVVGIGLMVGSFLLTTPRRGEAQAGGGQPLLEFRQLVGVSGVFLGNTVPLRDVPGGGAPWIIDEGRMRLKENGELRVRLGGLVIDPAIPPPFGGTNPVSQFFATLSCLDPATGAVNNLNTPTFPATVAGDAEIKAVLALPDTCVAPIVLIRGDLASIAGNPFNNPVGPDPSDPWFAASGF